MTEMPQFYCDVNLQRFSREDVEVDNKNFTELVVLDIIS